MTPSARLWRMRLTEAAVTGAVLALAAGICAGVGAGAGIGAGAAAAAVVLAGLAVLARCGTGTAPGRTGSGRKT